MVAATLAGLSVGGVWAADRPTGLRVEHLISPTALDVSVPRFSWHTTADRRGARQTGYQIQVASDLRLLRSGAADVWDSGRVASAESVLVPYGGAALASGAVYRWRVRVWDEREEQGPWSQPAQFGMGLLRPEDWKGSWITGSAQGGGNGYHSELARSPDDVKWAQVDLGAPTVMRAITLYPARPHNWGTDVPGFGFPLRYRIEVSESPGFETAIVVADRTDADQPNPGATAVQIDAGGVLGRYVRVVATKLYQRSDGPYLMAFAELEVMDETGANVARGCSVTAGDSIEEHDWSTAMLTNGSRESRPSSSSSPMLRSEFDLPGDVAAARAFVTALGYYELRINGRRVGDHVLDPGYTTVSRRVLYSAYDVTDMLRPGRNAVGVLLGSGWYRGSPALLLQMNIRLRDGTQLSVVTESNWRSAASPIVEQSLYHGETYDARLEQPGWDEPGFDRASDWVPVSTVVPPDGELTAQAMPPIRVVETLPPVAIAEPRPGVFVLDFGQNFSGWCRLSVEGPSGTEIKMRHAELLYEDGTVNQENLRSARATDRYILRGEGLEEYEPHFTYHGFRYVQVEGWPGRPAQGSIVGRVVHSDMQPRGSFACSNELINRVHECARWGYRTNFHSIPTDCPQRDERMGWMGDAQIAAEMGLYNFDTVALLRKFLRDIRDAQGEDGSVPDTVPKGWGEQLGDPQWGSAYPFILWDVYQSEGDLGLLEEHYEGIRAWADCLTRLAEGGILRYGHYGDWIAVVPTPQEVLSTAAYYRTCWIVSEVARALGRSSEAEEYRLRADAVASAFNSRLFDAATGVYGNGSQCSYAMPLSLGIVPESVRETVVANLVRDITEVHRSHLSTGFPSTKPLFYALTECNRGDLAYKMATQPDYPGWGYMLSMGATTIWELWQYATGPGMNSHNHPALGAIGAWYYRYLAGIRPGAPGYAVVDVKPHVVGDLTWAEAAVETPRGLTSVRWNRVDDALDMTVTIPANAHGRVSVPTLGHWDVVISEGETPVWRGSTFCGATGGVLSAAADGAWVTFEVESGRYEFRLRRAD